MSRSTFAMLASGLFLCAAIVLFSEQYLFSKSVQNSVWTRYFPLPFGPGWFITFVALLPAVWLSPSLPTAFKGGIVVLSVSILVAVPIAVLKVEGVLTVNNLMNQYTWVLILCFPPWLLHLALRGLAGTRSQE